MINCEALCEPACAARQLYALQACTDVSSSSACVRLSCSALALPSMPVRAELTAHVLPQQERTHSRFC